MNDSRLPRLDDAIEMLRELYDEAINECFRVTPPIASAAQLLRWRGRYLDAVAAIEEVARSERERALLLQGDE